jgi:hypothetical protein
MEMPIAEVVDRYTILCIKQMLGVDFDEEELVQYEAAVAGVDAESINELLRVNRRMWNLEAEISRELAISDFAAAGRVYSDLRAWTICRNNIKNQIAEQYGGPQNIKRY